MSDVDDALARRIQAAIWNTGVDRFAFEETWPECHRAKCQHRHPSPDEGFKMAVGRVAESVAMELRYHSTTRPDVAEPGDSPEDAATYTLAELLRRYNVHDAGTYVRAARLIVEAYPGLVPALGNTSLNVHPEGSKE
jgi:hypothetical protein